MKFYQIKKKNDIGHDFYNLANKEKNKKDEDDNLEDYLFLQ